MVRFFDALSPTQPRRCASSCTISILLGHLSPLMSSFVSNDRSCSFVPHTPAVSSIRTIAHDEGWYHVFSPFPCFLCHSSSFFSFISFSPPLFLHRVPLFLSFIQTYHMVFSRRVAKADHVPLAQSRTAYGGELSVTLLIILRTTDHSTSLDMPG